MNNLYNQFDNIHNPIQYCIDTILKEAKEEGRLVKQILYTMLSAYTNNPINLAINSPSGEGKTYVLQRVGELFPKQDAIFLAGMTEKALFHRSGALVVKNETGDYQSIEDRLEEMDSKIEDKEYERTGTKDRNLKQGLQCQITDLQKEKRDLLKEAKKLIDLSHKILVFLDSPRPELFNALMPLLSHDRYEVEYEYVDTNNGIKTKSNVLRGWPAVIFAQAIDYSHYQRYPEIQRRFIITNPKMTAEKYASAVDLIGDKHGLPDFAYQSKVVSDSDKEKAKAILKGIKQGIEDICLQPGKNNILVPFHDVLTKLLPKQKAFDMTVANRFFGFLTLLPIVNSDRRPRLIRREKESFIHQTILFALFEDLRESLDLMQYANGVRPYILEWYNEVFLAAYNSKIGPDSKVNSKREEVEEKRRALTSKELIDKTFELQSKKLSTKQILQTYINPLVNENYIDTMDSEIDKRANIYFPVLETSRYSKLFISDERNNIPQGNKIIVTDPTSYPDKGYVNSKIQEVLRCTSDKDSSIEIQNHEGKVIPIEELIDQFYGSPDEYFERGDSNRNEIADKTYQEQKDVPQTVPPEEYLQNNKIAKESPENQVKNIDNVNQVTDESINIFLPSKRNNFLYSFYHKNCEFNTNFKEDYEKHGAQRHSDNPLLYHSKADIERHNLKPQGKSWEIGTTTKLQVDKPCPVCERPGQRRVVELQPNYGELWRVVHDDGTVHEGDEYASVGSLYKSRGQIEEDVICPVCQELGQIITYRKDKIHKPFKYDYKISHGNKKQCMMVEEEHRNIILKYLGRYVEQEPETTTTTTTTKEIEKPQSAAAKTRTTGGGRRKRPRITCTVCFKPGAIRYINPKTKLTVYEHRGEPPIKEYTSPTTGKKYFRYRRCNGGRPVEGLEQLLNYGLKPRHRRRSKM